MDRSPQDPNGRGRDGRRSGTTPVSSPTSADLAGLGVQFVVAVLLFLFVGKWIFDMIFVFAGHRLTGSDLVMQILVWSPLSAAVTALAGAVALTMLRPLMEPRPV